MDLSQLNDQQKSTLKQFRDIFKDVELPDNSDIYLLRWLIAREFDLGRAEKMLRASLEWRKRYRIDSVCDDFKSPEVLTKYFPAGIVGQDKLLHPLWVVRYGQTDLKGILSSVKKKDYIMHVVKLVETNIRLTQNHPTKYQKTPGDSMVQATVLFDLDGFSMRHITYKPGMDSAIQLVQLYEANFPEWLRRVFVVNAPRVFELAFSLMKPFLHERTKNKISIYSHDSRVWKPALLAEISADNLPASYGGTMTDPDGNPDCLTMVNMGGEVPKSFYLTSKTEIANKKGLTVSSGSKEKIEVQVETPGSILCWEFYSEDSDIAFSVYRKDDNEVDVVVPRERVDCHISNEEGQICCDHAGSYVVEFDNTFSYLRSKKIWYSIRVEDASDSNGYGSNGTAL